MTAVCRTCADAAGAMSQRTTRRMALTDAGETFLTWVRHILNDIDEAHAATQSHAPEMSGVIRILTPGIFAVHTLRHWLQIYQPAARGWCGHSC